MTKKYVLIALLLGGIVGLHRFLVGKIGTGILYLLTFGFFGIGIFVDFVMILKGTFTDKEGYLIIDPVEEMYGLLKEVLDVLKSEKSELKILNRDYHQEKINKQKLCQEELRRKKLDEEK